MKKLKLVAQRESKWSKANFNHLENNHDIELKNEILSNIKNTIKQSNEDKALLYKDSLGDDKATTVNKPNIFTIGFTGGSTTVKETHHKPIVVAPIEDDDNVDINISQDINAITEENGDYDEDENCTDENYIDFKHKPISYNIIKEDNEGKKPQFFINLGDDIKGSQRNSPKSLSVKTDKQTNGENLKIIQNNENSSEGGNNVNNINNPNANANAVIPNPLMQTAINEKVKELNYEVIRLKNENEKVSKLKLEYEKLTKKLHRDIEEFNHQKEHELTEFNFYREEELKKIQKEKKLQSTRSTAQITSKKEKEEIENLKAAILKLQEDFKLKENTNKLANEKMRKQLDEANSKIADLNKTIEEMRSRERKNTNNTAKVKELSEKLKPELKFETKTETKTDSKPNNLTKAKRIRDNFKDANEKIDANSYGLIFPDKYHKVKSKVVKQDSTPDGKVLCVYDDNRKEVQFPSGIRKVLFPDGYQIVYFSNGDIKQVKTY
jgi:centromere protein J